MDELKEGPREGQMDELKEGPTKGGNKQRHTGRKEAMTNGRKGRKEGRHVQQCLGARWT